MFACHQWQNPPPNPVNSINTYNFLPIHSFRVRPSHQPSVAKHQYCLIVTLPLPVTVCCLFSLLLAAFLDHLLGSGLKTHTHTHTQTSIYSRKLSLPVIHRYQLTQNLYKRFLFSLTYSPGNIGLSN